MATSSWIAVLVTSMCLAARPSSPEEAGSLCPELQQCLCVRNADTSVDVSCRNISKLDPIVQVLRKEFSNTTINKLYVKNCSISDVPNKAFQNISITTILLQCPIVDVAADAFVGCSGLIIIRLDKTKLRFVPSALQAVPDVVQFKLEGGKVQTLKEELYNLFSLHSLSISNNKLHQVYPNAFRDAMGLQTLDLSHNSLEEIPEGLLDSLTNLTVLDLRQNHIKSIDGLFKKLDLLEYIILTKNSLNSVQNAFTGDMASVLELDLGSNRLDSLPGDMFTGKFFNLQKLVLSNIGLYHLVPGQFDSLQKLQELDLSENHLQELPSAIFLPLKNLTKLDLSQNRITSPSGIVESLPQLTELYLDKNHISLVDGIFQNLSRLTTLGLSYNPLNTIRDDTFLGLQNLQVLNLAGCQTRSFSKDCFHNHPNLEVLRVTGSHVTHLGDTFNNMPHITYLDFDFGKLQYLGENDLVGLPRLKNVSFHKNGLTSIYRTLRDAENLTSLNLASNQLRSLTRDSFPDVIRLEELRLGQGNPWSCDCRIRWLLEWLRETNYTALIDSPLCNYPPWQADKKLSSVDPENLTYWPKDCPDICTCRCQPWSRDLLISVNCSGRNLETAPEVLPDVVGELLLSGNLLRDVNYTAYLHLADLKLLDLEDNFLSSSNQTLPPNIRTLKLAGNNFTRFSVDTVQHLNLTEVTLSRNPWICDCEALPFKQWVVKNKNIIRDVQDVICVSSHYNNRTLYGLSDKDLCPSSSTSPYIFIISGVVSLLCVASILIVFCRYRKFLKVWFYSKGATCIKKSDPPSEARFDAFLSYSKRDESFVYTMLLPGLEDEEYYFEMCVQYKHFLSEKTIQENLTNAVQCSSRTILLLSKNFLHNEWCIPEFQQTHMQLLENKNTRRIVICYGELPSLGPFMQRYLESSECIRWEEKYFWEKLRFAMPKKKVQRETSGQRIINSNENTPLLT